MLALIAKASDWWWRHVPERLGLVAPGLGRIGGDGSYLGTVPVVGVVVPLGALVLGVVEGWSHFKPPVEVIAGQTLGTSPALLYTYTMSVMVTLAVVSGLGAGVGLWLWIGYVTGDLFGYQLFGAEGSARSVDILVISYVLLALLVVAIPFVTSMARRQLSPLLQRLGPVAIVPELVVAVVVAGVLAYSWAHATPTLIRPLNGFPPGSGNDAAFIPLTRMPWDLVWPVVIVAGARVVVEHLSRALPARPWTHAVTPITLPPRGAPTLLPLAVVAKAALGAVLLEGVYQERDDALVGFLVLLGILVLRSLIGYVRPWVRLMNAIPIALRIVVGAGVAFLVARAVLGTTGENASSFADLLEPVLIGAALMTLLVPGEAPRREAST